MRYAQSLDFNFLAVVDTLNIASTLILCGESERVLANRAFPGCACGSGDGEEVMRTMNLGSRVSRKKDFVPAMDGALSEWRPEPALKEREARELKEMDFGEVTVGADPLVALPEEEEEEEEVTDKSDVSEAKRLWAKTRSSSASSFRAHGSGPHHHHLAAASGSCCSPRRRRLAPRSSSSSVLARSESNSTAAGANRHHHHHHDESASDKRKRVTGILVCVVVGAMACSLTRG